MGRDTGVLCRPDSRRATVISSTSRPGLASRPLTASSREKNAPIHGDCLMGTCRRRKTARDILAAFRRLRACYPRRRRLYVVMDNLNSHRHPILRAFYRTHRITVVPTPTYASWLKSHRAPPRRDAPVHRLVERLTSHAAARSDCAVYGIAGLVKRCLPSRGRPFCGVTNHARMTCPRVWDLRLTA
jgi:hypothetical protein